MCTPEKALVDKTKTQYYKNFLAFDVALPTSSTMQLASQLNDCTGNN